MTKASLSGLAFLINLAGHSVLLANTLLYATAWGFVAVVAMPAA